MDVKFIEIFNEKKSAISSRWLDAMIASYPNDNSGFLMNQKTGLQTRWVTHLQ